MGLQTGHKTILPFIFDQIDLLAGTSFEIVAPHAGYLTEIDAICQLAITTGGAITVLTGSAGAVTVLGLSVTFADADAKGTRKNDLATVGSSTRYVAKGERIQVVPAAAFATAGRVNGFLHLSDADVSPALPAA